MLLRETLVSVCVVVALCSTSSASSDAPDAVGGRAELGGLESTSVDDVPQSGEKRRDETPEKSIGDAKTPSEEHHISDAKIPDGLVEHESTPEEVKYTVVPDGVHEVGEGSGHGKNFQSLGGDTLYSGTVLGEDEVSDFFAEARPLTQRNDNVAEKKVDDELNLMPLKSEGGNVLLRSSQGIGYGESSNTLEDVTTVQASHEADTSIEEVDLDPVSSSKVLSLSGNSFMTFTKEGLFLVRNLTFTFQARLGDSVLLYIRCPEASEFISLTIDPSGALKLATSVLGTEVPDSRGPPDSLEDGSEGSGSEDTFVDTELESVETVVEDSQHFSTILHSNVVDGSWHTLVMGMGVKSYRLNMDRSYGPYPTHELNVTLDGRLSTWDMDLKETWFFPCSHIFFGYIPDLAEVPADCYSFEMCPASTSGSKYQYDMVSQTCRRGYESGFTSVTKCLAECEVPGVTSRYPLSGCLKDVSVDGEDLFTPFPQFDTDVLTIVPRGRQISAPFSDACPQLASPRPAVSLPHPGAHFQLPPPCRPPFALSLELRPFTSHHHDPPTPAILVSGHLQLSPPGGQGSQDEFKWKLVVKHQKLHFSVVGLNKSVSSLSSVDTNAWNYVNLTSNGRLVTVSLNGLHHQLSFDGRPVRFLSFTVGDHKMGITACLNNIVLDGRTFDARQFISPKNGVLVGLCLEKAFCLHGGQVVAGGDFNCNCTDTAYDGPHCQFLRYPRSCSDYRHLGYATSGPYFVDVDGEGKIPPLEAWCDFLETSTNTEFSHNLPQNFVIKRDSKQSRQLNISYRGGQTLQGVVKKLATSMLCQQKIEFSCRNFPLKLARNKTLLSYDGLSYTNRLGSTRSGVCPCKEKESCSKSDAVCNCDVADGGERSDIVWLTDPEHLPLSSFVFGGHGGDDDDDDDDDDDSELRLSLGSVSCSEPLAAAKAVSLLRTSSKAQLTLAKASSLSFAFKTLQSDAVLLQIAQSATSRPIFTVLLRHGTGLVITYDDVEVTQNLAGYPLNSGEWQHVQVAGSEGQLRLTLNGHSAYAELLNFWSSFSRTESVVTFGGGDQDPRDDGIPGFIGCIQDVRANFVPVDFESEVDTRVGCSDLCALTEDAYGGRCKLVDMPEEYKAKCGRSLPSGDYDVGSSNGFSFTNSEAEVLYDQEGDDLLYAPHNPLTHDLSFVFRTREASALLLFAYDSSQNVLQIHLAEPNLVHVFFNDGFEVRNISVGTYGKRMNMGSPILFALERREEEVVVGVSIDGCWFNTTSEASMSYILPDQYQQFPFQPPPSHLIKIQQSKTVPLGFLSIHLGGAKIGGAESLLPNLVGCITDLTINYNPDTLSVLADGLKTTAGEVREGCVDTNAGCGPTKCLNGGRCLPTFTEDSPHPTCDCSGTSHSGVNCTVGTCYKLRQTLDSLEIPLAIDSNDLDSNNFDINLDFAVAIDSEIPHQLTDTRIIAFYTSVGDCRTNHVEVGLTSTSSLNVGVKDPHTTVVWTLPPWVLRADLLQGNRHNLTLSYKQPTLSFYFNGRRILLGQPTETIKRKNCSSHGYPIGPLTRRLIVGSYMLRGSSIYISNFRMNFGGKTYDFPSLFPRWLPSSEINGVTTLNENRCPQPTSPVYMGAARLPADAARTATPMSSAPILVPYGSEEASANTESDSDEETDSPTTWIILLLIGAVILLIIIIIVLAFCIIKAYKKKQTASGPPSGYRIQRSFSRQGDPRVSTPSNIYYNAESIPLRRGEMASYVSATPTDDPEAGAESAFLMREPVDPLRLSVGFHQQPPIMGSLSDEVQGQLGSGHSTGQASIANNAGTQDTDLTENGHLVNYKGLSMANDMCYELAQHQNELQRQQLERISERDSELEPPSSGNGHGERGESLQGNTDTGIGPPVSSHDDSNIYENYDFVEEAKNNADETQGLEDTVPHQVSFQQPTDAQPTEVESRGTSSEEEMLEKTPTKDVAQNADPSENRQSHSSSSDDDGAAHSASGQGQFVRYSAQPEELPSVNNPLYDTVPQIEQEQQQRVDPDRQEEHHSQIRPLETHFMDETPETEVTVSDSVPMEPKGTDGSGMPGDKNEAAEDSLKDEGTSVDEVDDDEGADDGWFTKRHLVISLSSASDLPVQKAKIISKQSSSNL